LLFAIFRKAISLQYTSNYGLLKKHSASQNPIYAYARFFITKKEESNRTPDCRQAGLHCFCGMQNLQGIRKTTSPKESGTQCGKGN